MTAIEQLQAALQARHITVTDEQAEAMAVRIAGSVDAYLAQLAANDEAAESYTPLSGEAPAKFAEPLAYDLEAPEASGLPAQP